MFSNIGMTPFAPGGGTGGGTPVSQPQSAAAPGADPRSAGRGETGAAALRAETNQPVRPPRQPAPAGAAPSDPGRGPTPDTPRGQLRLADAGTRFTPMVSDAQTRLDAAAEAAAIAGPPPAFQRSLLEARRAETAAPDPAPARISAPAPPDTGVTAAPGLPEIAARRRRATAATGALYPTPATVRPGPPAPGSGPAGAEASDGPLRAAIRRLMEERAPMAAPPSAETRAQTEFAGLRRIETPYDTATLDVTR